MRPVITRRSGFSLIELMITVALVGILTAVATGSLRGLKSRARQAEAKASLAAMFAVEKTFYVEHESYTICIGPAGYSVDSPNRYYYTGSQGGAGPDLCGPDGASYCAAVNWGPTIHCDDCSCDKMSLQGFNDCGYGGNISANSALPAINDCSVGGVVPSDWRVTKNTFLLGAIGSVSPSSPVYDEWSIDQNGQLSDVQSGL